MHRLRREDNDAAAFRHFAVSGSGVHTRLIDMLRHIALWLRSCVRPGW
jgi:hypothetical protein